MRNTPIWLPCSLALFLLAAGARPAGAAGDSIPGTGTFSGLSETFSFRVYSSIDPPDYTFDPYPPTCFACPFGSFTITPPQVKLPAGATAIDGLLEWSARVEVDSELTSSGPWLNYYPVIGPLQIHHSDGSYELYDHIPAHILYHRVLNDSDIADLMAGRPLQPLSADLLLGIYFGGGPRQGPTEEAESLVSLTVEPRAVVDSVFLHLMYEIAPVPEPSTGAMGAGGVALLLLLYRLRRARS